MLQSSVYNSLDVLNLRRVTQKELESLLTSSSVPNLDFVLKYDIYCTRLVHSVTFPFSVPFNLFSFSPAFYPFARPAVFKLKDFHKTMNSFNGVF